MGWVIGGSIPGRGWEFFFSLPRPSRSGTWPASYPIGTRGSSRGGKTVGTWSWSLISI